MIYVIIIFWIILFIVWRFNHEIKKLTVNNVWETKQHKRFIIVDYAIDKNNPIQIKYIPNDGKKYYFFINDEIFYKHIGNKKTHPEYFL